MAKSVSPCHILRGLSLLTAAIFAGLTSTAIAQTIFFTENFDDTNFAARGWYDGNGGTIDSSNHAPVGTASLVCHWALGGTGCTGGTPKRHLFTASDTVYVGFYMKLGSASVPWQGSGKPYHPHIFQILTDADSDFVGPNSALFSALIETNLFTPRFAEADSMAVNILNIGTNLLASVTDHSVAGCNGDQNASSTCYTCTDTPGGFCNSTDWDAASPAFVNNTWHHVEAYLAMNSTTGGIANPDGIFQYWVDGKLVINYSNVYLRTGNHPSRKFHHLLLAPFIGDGSPIAQDLWLDNLVVADQRPKLSPPTNLRIVP